MTITSRQEQRRGTYSLTLNAQEIAYLDEILTTELGDTRVEFRRTDSPAFQEKVHREEDVIRRLLEKLHVAEQTM